MLLLCLKKKKYSDACTIFDEISDYKDSKEKADTCNYQMGVSAYQEKKYKEAVKYLQKTSNKDRDKYLYNACFLYAEECYNNSNTDEALIFYKKITDKNLLTETMMKSIYEKAKQLFDLFLEDYKNVNNQAYSKAASELFEIIDGYKNTKELQYCINIFTDQDSEDDYLRVINKVKDNCSKETYDYVVKLNDNLIAYNNLINHAGVYRCKSGGDKYGYIHITSYGAIESDEAWDNTPKFNEGRSTFGNLYLYYEGKINNIVNKDTFDASVYKDEDGNVDFRMQIKDDSIIVSNVDGSGVDYYYYTGIMENEYIYIGKAQK